MRVRTLVLAAATAVALRPVVAHAQSTLAAEPLAPVVDASRLQPGSWTYRLTVLRDGLPSSAGQRTVTVRETSAGGVGAWAIVETRLLPTGLTTDSVIASRELLVPIHWEGTAGGARLAAAVSNDTLYGGISGTSGGSALRSSLRVGLPRGVVLSSAMLESLVRLLPLAPGWSAPVPMLLVSAAGARTLPAQLTVEREERVQVPAGAYDCWVLTLRAGAAEKRLWVSKGGQGVVKTEERMPDVGDAVLEQALAATGPR